MLSKKLYRLTRKGVSCLFTIILGLVLFSAAPAVSASHSTDGASAPAEEPQTSGGDSSQPAESDPTDPEYGVHIDPYG